MFNHCTSTTAPSAHQPVGTDPESDRPAYAKAPSQDYDQSRWRFAQEIDAAVAEWGAWIRRRRNRHTWNSWSNTHPCLVDVDPTPSTTNRINIDTQADAIYALMTVARSEPAAVTALLGLLAPVWMHAKKRYLSLETAELAAAILSENLDAPSTATAPVRAIIKKATRQSDRTFWVPVGDQPARHDLTPMLAVRPAPGDFVETLVTTMVINDTVKEGSCLHLRMTGHTPGHINTVVGSVKRARTRTRKERDRLAVQLDFAIAA